MKHRHWIVPALLLAAIAIAAEPPTPDPAQRAQERAASNAYYAELAERLSQSSNPRHLIIAARLLGRVGAGPKTGADARTVAVTPSAEALLARAIELGATDPWIWWMIWSDTVPQ